MNAVEIITFLRNNVIQGTRLQVTPYYKGNTLMVNGVFLIIGRYLQSCTLNYIVS